MKLLFIIHYLINSTFVVGYPVTRSRSAPTIVSEIATAPQLAEPMDIEDEMPDLEPFTIEDEIIEAIERFDSKEIDDEWGKFWDHETVMTEFAENPDTTLQENINKLTREEFLDFLKMHGFEDLQTSGFYYDIMVRSKDIPKPLYNLDYVHKVLDTIEEDT